MARQYEGQFVGTTPTYSTFDATSWGGRKEDVVFDPNTGQFVPVAGTSGEDQDISRYRQMAQAPGQPAPRVGERDFFSRMAQDDGIRRLDDAASGRVSQGADLVQQQTRDAVSGIRSTAASTRGGNAARIAAMKYGNREGATRTAIGNRQAQAVKAGEMADARGAHMAALTNQREQDIGLATERAKLEQDQRRRDAEREAAFERMGWETRNAGMGARLKRTAAQQAGAAGARGLAAQDAAREWGHTKDTVASVAGGISGATAGAAHSQTSNDDDDFYSDERTKNVMYSPGEIKDPVQYPAFMEREEGRRALVELDGGPYKTEPDIGVGGAPRGYAAAREGQAGSMFGNAPAVQTGYEKPGAENAPGTSDWARYGEPAKKDEPVDWAHGGATTKKGKKPSGGGMQSLAKFLSGFRGRDMFTSDARAKDEAFKLGMEMGQAKAEQKAMMAQPGWKPTGGRDREKEDAALGDSRAKDSPDGSGSHVASDGTVTLAPVTVKSSLPEFRTKSPVSGPSKLDDEVFEVAKRGPEARASIEADRQWGDGQRATYASQKRREGGTKTAAKAPVLNEQVMASLGSVRSDEEAKDVIDLDGDDKDRMRDGSSDPRTNSFDKTFRRDTKADQKRVKKTVEDKAGKDADAMMASMRASMGQGPTARVEDLGNDAPDLSTAAKAREGQIPDDAMYRAMKSMQPSLYAYKPGFKPAEQRPGEVQAGPMANPMKKDPIAGLAVEQEPSTGLLAIDKDKALKLTMGSLAVLANDVERLKRKKGAKK